MNQLMLTLGATVRVGIFSTITVLQPLDARAAETTSGQLERCAICHLVPDVNPGATAPKPGTPSFQDIADDNVTYTNDRLRSFLRQPHFPMKGLVLTEGQITEIIVYLEALRGRPR